MRLCIIFDRFVPSLYSRLVAVGKICELHAIEVFSLDKVYAVDKIEGSVSFNRTTLLDNPDVLKDRGVQIHNLIFDSLNAIQPDVVAIPGWSGQASFAAIYWCLTNNRPSILMSQSTFQDRPRNWWSEFPKRRIVRSCNTGLVGGSLQLQYLTQLGMPKDKIWTGYAAVDNFHFANGAESAQGNAADLRSELDLPENFFLTVNRFISEKNLFTLLRAYSNYKNQAGEDAWKLVLMGDGSLRPALLSIRKELNLEESVLTPGFKQYDELPKYYGFAKAFILASISETWGLVVNEAMASGLPVLVSERCGCAPDLVHDGENGFTFDPYKEEELADKMVEISSGKHDLKAMGEASRRIIAKWTPEIFASNLLKAAEAALNKPQKKASIIDKAILQILMHR